MQEDGRKKVYLSKEEIRLFFFCIGAGIFLYFARIVNVLPNPDAIWNGLAYKDSWGWESSLGRYMIRCLQDMRGHVVATEYITLTCIVLLATVCICVVRLFGISQAIPAIVTVLLLMTAPTVGSTLSYYYCSDLYFLSYLLATAGVLAAVRWRKIQGCVICALCLCISAAVYQAYLGVAITLCFLHLLFMVFDENISLKSILKEAFRLSVSGCTGIALYLISNRLIQSWWRVSPAAERGFDSMGKISLEKVPELIFSAYRSFFEYFFAGTMINNFYGGRRIINLLFALCGLTVVTVILTKTKLPLYRKYLAAAGVLLLPVSVMSIVLIAPDASIYDATGVLMLPTMNYVYVAFLLLFWKQRHLFGVKAQQICRAFLIVSCALVCYMLVVLELSAQSYMKHHVNKTRAVAYEMVDRIEETVDNSGRYKLCLVGTMEKGNYPEVYEKLRQSVHWTTASHKTVWDTFLGRQSCWINYMSHETGKSYQSCSEAEYNLIVKSPKFGTMKNFPDDSSVTVIGNLVVIKLSEP